LRTYGDEAVREQAIEILVDDKYPQILDEAKIEASGMGKLDDVISMDPPKFSFTIPLAPVVTIGDLKSVKQDYVEPVITDEQVDKAIKTVQANYATPTDVEREAKEGDMVNMELSASFVKPEEGEDKEFISKTPHQAIIGENDLHKETWPFENFSKNVIGMKTGETKTFKHKFAKDDRVEKLQGRELEFTVELRGVQEIVLPELNDEFVMKIGQFQAVDAFKDYMRRRLEADNKAEYDGQYYDDLLDKMVALCSFKYAPHMLEEETHSVLHSLQDTLAQQQMDLDTYLKVRKLSMEELEEKELKPVAVKRLERSLLVTEVSKQEKLEVTDEELENSFNQTVNEISMTLDQNQIRKSFNDKKFSQAVAFEAANRAMNRKVLEYLRGLASGTPSAEKPAEKAAEGEAKPKKPRAKKVAAEASEAPKEAAE
jgi:trigger factor